ncbi:MAG: 1-deoxy-D-xylulose-5-phosphate reductoisomerase, partial [Treponema sp.]|nr:1-deoxy-D-xylulose-5-phosphate reductoisomerase [Treponema sp.]
MPAKRVLVLGATGSIGTSTLDIIRSQKERYICCGISANNNKDSLLSLAEEFKCPSSLTSQEGNEGIKKLIETSKPDIVVNGIAGSAGLIPSLLTLESGTDLALANKESVVMAGPLIFAKAREKDCHIIPVDSEHSAIFTLISAFGEKNIDQLIITASGGPFRNYTKEQLKTVTLQDALKHPTWNMGQKITVDSASLANTGLEVIEACRLF